MVRGQKTKNQKGGYKLKRDIRHSVENPESYELLPHILKLINGVEQVDILSVSSKFSIVFKIVVSEDASDFVDKNEVPVKFFAAKLCFVNQYGNMLTTPETPENVFVKHPISMTAFETEKKTQRDIWVNSVENRYAMVCPILTDGRILDDDTSRRIIDKLFSQDDPYKNYVLSWLKNGFAIGMYTMELIDPTLITFEQSGRNLDCLPSICASILVLMKCGVVHRDLHTNNVLINPDTHKSKIIDFGQVITMDALNAELTQYVSDKLKFDKIKQFKDKLMTLTSSSLDTSEQIMEALRAIVEMEREYNLLKGNYKRNKDGTVMVGVGRNPLKYYYDAAVKNPMGDRILSEYNQIISSGVPQTPVKVGVQRSRFFAENVQATHRTKRSDPFGNYVPKYKKKVPEDGTPIDESETLIVSETPVDEESDAIGGTTRKRCDTRRKRRATRRKPRRRATRRRTRR